MLSVVCVGGLGLAVWMIAAWGRKPSDRQPLLVVSDESLEVAERTVRAAVVGIVGGIIAGVLVAGLGGRLMMRVLAATSGDSAQGLVTEAHETVGEITLGGSVGFVVFNGIFFGAIGGVGYVLLRSWLPSRPWLGGLVYGARAVRSRAARRPQSRQHGLLDSSPELACGVACRRPVSALRDDDGIGGRAPRPHLATDEHKAPCDPRLLTTVTRPRRRPDGFRHRYGGRACRSLAPTPRLRRGMARACRGERRAASSSSCYWSLRRSRPARPASTSFLPSFAN